MKDACIIIAIILIIVAGDIWMQTYLTRTADEIGKKLQELKHNTILAKETDNRDEIKNEVSEIEKVGRDKQNLVNDSSSSRNR